MLTACWEPKSRVALTVMSSDEEGGGRNGEGEGVKDRARMPCRGVSDMDNKLVDHYLK